MITVELKIFAKANVKSKVMIGNNNDRMSDNLPFYLDRAIRSEEAGFVDPEFFIIKPLPENLSTSYGGTCCVVRYVRTYPDFLSIFSSQITGNGVLISYRIRHQWKD